MSEWQPIETAPRDKTIIVVMDNYVVTAKWNNDPFVKNPRPYFHCESLHFMGKNWQRENQPIYWMPLPEAPVIIND